MTALTGREVQLVAYPARRGAGRPTSRSSRRRSPASGPGEVLVRNTWTSVDPGLRLRLREHGPEGYFVAFPLRAPMDGIMTVGEVVESRADGFARRRHGLARVRLARLRGRRRPARRRSAASARCGGSTSRTRRRRPTSACSAANGLTAYAGLLRVAGLRDGDVVWVSAAAGAVGSIVAQLAKLRGHRVIGSAGSTEKVAYLLEELGLDAAFDYHDGPVAELLREAAPDGIDVYFDNVGGDHLEAAIGALRRSGRIAICGAISEYDAAEPPPGPSNLFLLVAKDLEVRGFRGSSHVDLLDEMQRELGALAARAADCAGSETVVEGLEHAPDALARMMRGETVGKTLVRIA